MEEFVLDDEILPKACVFKLGDIDKKSETLIADVVWCRTNVLVQQQHPWPVVTASCRHRRGGSTTSIG